MLIYYITIHLSLLIYMRLVYLLSKSLFNHLLLYSYYYLHNRYAVYLHFTERFSSSPPFYYSIAILRPSRNNQHLIHKSKQIRTIQKPHIHDSLQELQRIIGVYYPSHLFLSFYQPYKAYVLCLYTHSLVSNINALVEG